MKKIIGIIKPFSMKQKFFVYIEGEDTRIKECGLDEINDTLTELINEYEIQKIDIAGPHSFANKIIKDFKEKNISKYNNDELVINLI